MPESRTRTSASSPRTGFSISRTASFFFSTLKAFIKQRSEIRGQKSEVRNQRSEIGGQLKPLVQTDLFYLTFDRKLEMSTSVLADLCSSETPGSRVNVLGSEFNNLFTPGNSDRQAPFEILVARQ